MNPVLPRQHFVPDSEARVMPDGRLYVYGSYDISGRKGYCSHVLHAFSTDNMIDWVDHGVCFESKDVPFADSKLELFAPDCIYRDGKYYLYFCMKTGVEGVAVSDTPWGPFTDPTPIEGAHKDSIDPSVFIDDDGQAYYFWGQFHLRGAKLNADMRTLDLSTLNTNIIDEKRYGFHEGSSLRKVNGLYYMVYADISRGKANCLGYAVAESPLGPYEYKGIIIDNTGCDPKTWNNHGSIGEYKGQWYVFYHKSSQNSFLNRRLCIEPIYFNEKMEIQEVEMTTQGCEGPISTDRVLDAANACRVGGFGTEPHVRPDPLFEGEEILANMERNGWAVYKYLQYEKGVKAVSVLAESSGDGILEIWNQKKKLGELQLKDTEGKRVEFTAEIAVEEDVQPLYLEWYMKDGAVAQAKQIRFVR